MLSASMDITNILNSKGAAAAAAAAGTHGDQHLQQHLAHQNAHSMHDSNSDRGTSPHGSEHSSRYSNTNMGQPLVGMRYPSPTAMQNPMPMMGMGGGFRQDSGFDNGMVPQASTRPQAGQTPDPSAPRKAFECGTCGKDFARRSDLARHGELPTFQHFLRDTGLTKMDIRADTYWSPTSRLRLPGLW
jgi:hypothetical protein